MVGWFALFCDFCHKRQAADRKRGGIGGGLLLLTVASASPFGEAVPSPGDERVVKLWRQGPTGRSDNRDRG